LAGISTNQTTRNVHRSTNNNFRFQALSTTGLQRVQDANNLFTGFFFIRDPTAQLKKIARKKYARSHFNVDSICERAGDLCKEYNIIYRCHETTRIPISPLYTYIIFYTIHTNLGTSIL